MGIAVTRFPSVLGKTEMTSAFLAGQTPSNEGVESWTSIGAIRV